MAEDDRSSLLPRKAYGFPAEAFDSSTLPDYDTNFLPPEHLEAFIQALTAPDPVHSPDEASAPRSPSLRSFSSYDFTKRSSVPSISPDDPQAVARHAEDVSGGGVPAENGNGNGNGNASQSMFITAQNDWAPVHEKVVRPSRKGRRSRRVRVTGRRTKDETREGYLYGLLKWPFLFFVSGWVVSLAVVYVLTRAYIATYERFVTWRGRRERLRKQLRATSTYREWVGAAKELDRYLGNEKWKEENAYAYYDSDTVRRVWEQLKKSRVAAEAAEREAASSGESADKEGRKTAVEDLKVLIEACVKNNFVGVENPRLYSQTYYGTKNLVENFIDEVEKSIKFLSGTNQLEIFEKKAMFKRIHANYGRSALCLSGGASFAYYHFGVVKALLEENLLPDVITGTSGGALVASLVATRTDEELKKLLVPALADKLTACQEPISVWFRRWWATGARFDSADWAKKCSWMTYGSMTFREAYERTGRILNVSCVPADPHSPTILCNYLTSPDCVIWSAVLASAAVPGILNPVVLMMKTREGHLVPYSFGHKWKDGSLRTDIPIKALNMHFNVNFTIVSQVNPHINLFFFSSRGSVGQPVTHRKGRGWRGGYLGSATEQYIKLDLTKWLKVLRHLELLPRPLGQDWSQLWLQQFGGTITIWPKSIASDFVHILSDPDPPRLARMIHEGQQSVFPKLKFIANRLRVERQVEKGRLESRPYVRRGSIETIISEDELRNLLRARGGGSTTNTDDEEETTTEAEGESVGHRDREGTGLGVLDPTEEAVVDDESDVELKVRYEREKDGKAE